jgi:glucosylceramidase
MDKNYLKITFFKLLIISISLSFFSCSSTKEMKVQVYETSANGNSLKKITDFSQNSNPIKITLNPEEKFQTITGFGGSFTEASASLLNRLSKAKRKEILDAYFSEEGAKYSLTRTHIASCDFSLSNYTYAKVENDLELKHFTIEDDKDDIIPMILEAKSK